MNYIFELHSRASLSQSAEEKHQEIINKINLITPPWGLHDQNIKFPGFRDHFIATLNLNKDFGDGIKCTISYRYRNKLEDRSSSDDRIYFEIKIKKINYTKLVNEICPIYIRLFDAYFAAIYNENLIFEDYEKSRYKDLRKDIIRFYPVCFIDNELCTKALRISAKEVFEKLENVVEKVDLLSNGIFIHNDSKFFSIEEANKFNELIWEVIGMPR